MAKTHCIVCGKRFTGKHGPTRIYCSPPCQRAGHKLNQYAKQAPLQAREGFVSRLTVAFGLAIVLVPPATACERTIAWERPTTTVSGEPLPLSSIAAYQFSCGPTPGQYTTPTMEIPGAVEEYRFACADAVPDFGRWYCALRAVATYGEISDWSNEVVLINELAPLQAPQFIPR